MCLSVYVNEYVRIFISMFICNFWPRLPFYIVEFNGNCHLPATKQWHFIFFLLFLFFVDLIPFEYGHVHFSSFYIIIRHFNGIFVLFLLLRQTSMKMLMTHRWISLCDSLIQLNFLMRISCDRKTTNNNCEFDNFEQYLAIDMIIHIKTNQLFQYRNSNTFYIDWELLFMSINS